MANLIRIDNFTNKYSENLLSTDSLFNVLPTINYNGNGSLTIVDDYALGENIKSAELYTVQDVVYGIDESFDFGSALSYTATNDGSYIFQFAVNSQAINASPDYAVNLQLDVYINSVLTDSYINQLTLTDLTQKDFYFFAQSFNLITTQNVNFKFKILADSVGTPNPNFTLNFSGFKLELDDKDIGTPTSYSYPVNYFIISGLQQFGLYNYQHAGGTQAIPSTTWADVVNDGGGALTSTDCGYSDVTIYDTSTNLIDLSDLSTCDSILARFQATSVTTTVNNQVVKVRVLLSVGSLNVSLPFFYEEYDTSGVQDTVFGDVPIYILSELVRTFPAKFQIWSSAACTLDLSGFNFKVEKRLL